MNIKEVAEIIRTRNASRNVPFALATVVRVRGSSYRRPGARMLISVNGRMAGSVSGGCLERDVISKGQQVLLTGIAVLASYDTTEEGDMAVGTSLGCEGRIEILIEKIGPGQPWRLEEAVRSVLSDYTPRAVATVFAGGEGAASLVGACFNSADGNCAPLAPRENDTIAAEMAQALRTRTSRVLSLENAEGTVDILIEPFLPPVTLLIFGGGHDVPPLVQMAKNVGHEVIVVDRRPEVADAARFPGADLVLAAAPHQVLDRFAFHDRTAAVLMNHHYETDRDLLGVLAHSSLLYLGVLGPRKRTNRIIDDLRQSGITLSGPTMDALRSPAGLDIGSENPEEIALSILAEIQATLSGRDGRPLRERASAIHEAELSQYNGELCLT